MGEYINRPEFELYDLRTDPWESKNLASDPEYAKVLAELQREMRNFQMKTSDPWLLKWDYQ